MLRLFLSSTLRLAILTVRTYLPRRGQPRPSGRRMLVMTAFIPLFALVQAIHWLGFALDEILFRGYRRVTVNEPLFILGIPRSGTTHLHRVIADDTQFTTFSTWECLFALSVSARYFWRGVARLDRLLGAPLKRLLQLIERRAFGSLEAIHGVDLAAPEEDYFALTPVLACFILILPFAHSDFVWRMGRFASELPADEREQLLAFYARCLQKHLYVHRGRRLLSKNAAFASWMPELARHFPDARFIVCVRAPEQTAPSQLSSIAAGVAAFDSTSVLPHLHERLAHQVYDNYRVLDKTTARLGSERCACVTMHALQANLLEQTVSTIYRRLELTLLPAFAMRLRAHADTAANYRSRHRYNPEAFGLDANGLASAAGAAHARLRARALDSSPPPDRERS